MILKDVANELVTGCRENRAKENLHKLYAPDAQSVEAADMGNGRTVTGIAAIEGKHDWWENSMTVHSQKVSGPFMHGEDRFAVFFDVDYTEKASGTRGQMQEVGIYQVADGKIVREEFFYGT